MSAPLPQSTLDALADAETLWLFARQQTALFGHLLDVIRARNAGSGAVTSLRPKASGTKAARHAFRAVPGLREGRP